VTGKPKAVVCGTKFGRVYLAAFARDDCPFELAGVLARGSERSMACAQRYGVPLYTKPGQLPSDVQAACVVVSAAVNGGHGAELAQELMMSGIHVLQEHPLHHDELAACLRTARSQGVLYRLNSHYPYVPPVRRFIDLAQRLLGRQPPLFIDAQVAFQVTYTLFDILGRALGAVSPAGFGELAELPERLTAMAGVDHPYRSLDGVFAGVPLTLRLQNELTPADPDNYSHLFHRITIGTEGGHLTLANTHGPVLWSPRPHMAEDMRSLVRFDDSGAEHLDLPSTELMTDTVGPSYRDILATLWPAGAAAAMSDFWAAVQRRDDPARDGQYHLALTRVTNEAAQRFGPVRLLRRDPPRILAGADLVTT
jgi:pyochelin biosynthesis protein PchG